MFTSRNTMSIRSIDMSLQRIIGIRLLKASGYPPLGKRLNQLQPVVGDHGVNLMNILYPRNLKGYIACFDLSLYFLLLKSDNFIFTPEKTMNMHSLSTLKGYLNKFTNYSNIVFTK